jgi:hypothetical protein
MSSIIIATSENFFAHRSQNQCMFELSNKRSFTIDQRRQVVDNAKIAQVFKRHQVFFLSTIIQPTLCLFINNNKSNCEVERVEESVI